MSKPLCIPASLLVLLYLCLAAYVISSAPLFPERVATHFDGAGQPNRWMSRSAHLLFMSGFGLVFPLFPVALCFVLRFLPVELINLPRRDYWLAEERRGATFTYLLRHFLWFACMAVLFVLGIHHLIVQANRQSEAHLSTSMFLGVGGAFMAGIILWCLMLVWHFRRAPRSLRNE